MSTTRAFELPEGARPVSLKTQTIEHTTLLPNSIVLCINRGRTELRDTYDGVHVPIPPGYFETEYGAAKHFQRRLIVPGTRNLEVGGYQSWIGILGSADGRVKADDAELCRPFTDEELTSFGEKVEAIDRDALSNETDRKVVVKRVSGSSAGRGILGQSAGTARGTQINADAQVSDAAREAAAHVFDTPETNDAREDEVAAGRRSRR